MPERYSGIGIVILYPETWNVEDDESGQTVTLESPEGGFMTVTRLEDAHAQLAAMEQVKQAMELEYDEVEQETLVKVIAGSEWTGVTQRFVYLDMIITSHLLAITIRETVYLVQMQAEDREMERLQLVFDAMLTSMCQAPVQV